MLERIRLGHLLLFWFVLNLIQAALTPLDPDEAYYWMYAGQLDWGYFDHPPLVALFIKLGKDWLPGTLGLRLGHVLCTTATVAGIGALIDNRSTGDRTGRSTLLFALLIFAQPVLQLYGFIATPDGPLLLGTVLFFLAYRAFIRRESTAAALPWGASMAFLFYAKYHGILVIFFTIVADRRHLWRDPRFYLASCFGAVLFLPHLYWQYLHDFPSFRYHLFGRNAPYELAHTTGYLLSQLLIFNPFLWYYYWLTLRAGPQDRLERAFFWLIGGFWLFFLLSTFKGHTEPHWTAVLVLPLAILLCRRAAGRSDWQRPLWRIGLFSFVFFVVLRSVLLFPTDGLPAGLRKQFYHVPWVAALDRVTPSGQTLVLENSYRNAAIYAFYAGRPAWTFTNFHYRRNQYDLWQSDTLLHNRPVLIAGHRNWDCPHCDSLEVFPKFFRYLAVDSFQVVKKVDFRLDSPLPDTLRPGSVFAIGVSYRSPYSYPIRTGAGNWPLRLFMIVRTGREEWVSWPLESQRDHVLPPTGSAYRPYGAHDFRVTYPRTAPRGEVEVRFGLAYAGMVPLQGMSPVYSIYVRQEED